MSDIISRLEESARENADRIAFYSQTGCMTYGELWRRSGNLAGWINLQKGNSREPVIIYGHKDPMMLVGFLACVRSGRAYCPMDTSMPPDRVRSVRGMIGDPLVLTEEDIARISRRNIRYSHPDACWGEDVFYIIFTSGSTGTPKGVQITENNLRGWLEWALTLDGGIRRNAIFLNQAPYSFDLSVMDLYLALSTGGRIVSVDRELQKDVRRMVNYLREGKVEYWVSTPSFAELCLGEPEFSSETMPSVRTFLFCGEVLSNETALRLMDRFPRAEIINTYGPTEATVCVTQTRITRQLAEADEPLPVGYPAGGTQIRIDPKSREIIIAGPTVSPGYYGDPERTAESFAEDENGVRIYRTGDRGHMDETGMVYCEGRMDRQIKLHGYRIELEDIETNLEKLSGVARAVVVPSRTGNRIDAMTAFIVREGEEIRDDYSGRKAIRTGLKNHVPAYMVPKRIRFLQKLPVTGNGKIDRRCLEEQETREAAR